MSQRVRKSKPMTDDQRAEVKAAATGGPATPAPVFATYCPTCNGRGYRVTSHGQSFCYPCGGTGTAPEPVAEAS